MPRQSQDRVRTRPRSVIASLVAALLLVPVPFAVLPAVAAQAAENEITAENSLPGSPASEWDIEGAGDESIQGFATQTSVNRGETVEFKVDTDAADYRIDIYRLGWYQGNGARKVATIDTSATTESQQPGCALLDGTTNDNLVDCGNWSVSASWGVPADATSGLYIAKPTRADNGGASHIAFVVRDDDGSSDLLFQTSDTTWQAYNPYGGYNTYDTGQTGVNAQKVSYNRPVTTRGAERENWLFNAEYPMIRWLERNGYDVSYSSSIDTAIRPAELLEHQAFLSVGHDEYWSQEQRDAVEAARDAGVDLAFLSGNEVYWKIRMEDSTQDPAPDDHRIMAVYKEGSAATSSSEHQRCYANYGCDPSDTWTGLWRESPQSSVSNPIVGEPENMLTGQISWRSNTASMEVPGEFAKMRFWRNTDVAKLSPSGRVTLPYGTIGYEWNPEQERYANWYPPGRVLLSSTTVPSSSGSDRHHMSLYRAPSGALVFGAGTVQWTWGLDGVHDHGTFMDDPGNTENRNVQQATMNLLADMGAQPGTIQSGLVATAASTDTTSPNVVITSSAASVTGPGTRTVSGTAADAGGGAVAAVEVSTDGGSTWRRASGRESWSYTFTALAGAPAIRVRATDDSANLGAVVALGTAVTACPAGTSCASIFSQSVTGPENADASAVELGVKFRSDVPGQLVGIRFYKTSGNTGAHTGTLWSASGQPLATVTFAGESGIGWQEAAFSAPVTIQPGTTYVASYHTNTGHYATGTSFASAGVDSPPLHALRDGVDGPNGVYMYGPGGMFPANTWASGNYLVDVLFSSTVPQDTTPPTITATTPAADAAGANADANVTASFSEAIDPDTLTTSTFRLRAPGGNPVPATVTYSGVDRRAVLNPDTPLAAGTRYTAIITGGEAGIADAAGNRLAVDYAWGFLTAGTNTTAPIVSSTTPSANATGAAAEANVTVVFSEAMDAGSITSATIELRDGAGNVVPATVGYDAGTTSAVIDPNQPLALATNHTVTVKGGASGVRDATGIPLQADFMWGFATAGPDTSPPVVTGTWPTRDAADFGVEANIAAIFSEPMGPASVNGTTVQLRDAAGNLVTALITYDPTTRSAMIDPAAALAYSAEYTVTLEGGAGGLTDAAGNPMVDDYSWTFATIARAGARANPNIGPGGPLLIVKGATPFGAYLPEMIRGEGLNLFTVRTTSSFSASALAPYDTLVLGETALTPEQVTSLTEWVNAGGNLIAMRPSASLADLLGLIPAGGGLSEGYVKIDTSTRPGQGIEAATMQFHGTADLYRPRDAGTQVVAQLYSTSTSATEFPAVTLRSVGSAGGTAAAFAFDLARSIVHTRQGNPAWVGQERDGVSPIRSDDLFYSDYIDLSKVAIPQADEQQRLLANLITETTRDVLPVPRFWYLPRGEVAAIVMTADEHNGGSVPSRFSNELLRSTAGCYVGFWDCVRSTSYMFVDYPEISDAQARTYEQQGFEIALHPHSNCGTPNRAGFTALLTEQLAALGKHYPSITTPRTSRNDCVFWIDYTTVPEEEEKAGINLDANYYYWPPSWAATRPGMFTGSGMAQRFLSLDGKLIDVYQATTQLTDESGQAYPSTAIALMDGAIDKGYYGAFTANLHTDGVNATSYHDAVVTAAQGRSVPIITAEQLLQWTDGRNASSFTNLARNGDTMTFTLRAGEGATGLQAMLPTQGSTGSLQSILRGGAGVSYQTKVVKGVSYAVFPAVDGEYTAKYSVDSTAPSISGAAATVTGGTTAEVSWTTNEPASARVEFGTSSGAMTSSVQAAPLSTSHRIQLTGLAPNTTYYYRVVSTDAFGNTGSWPAANAPVVSFTTPTAAATDTSASQFGAGTPGAGTYVANSSGGEVMLAPLVGTEFDGTGLPAGWSTGAWTGGTTTFPNGTASVDGSWLRSNALVGSGRAVEFAGTFSGASYQNAGFAVTLGAGESWAMFGTNDTSGVLQARTRNAGGTVVDVALGSKYVGSEHLFRIEWDASVRFYIDGELVHTAATVGGTMRALASDYATGGGGLTLKWLRMTPYASSGSFLSRVHDAGTLSEWGAMSYSAQVPQGTTLALDVRTGDTATPDGSWTAFTQVGPGQDIPGSGRYLQYRARFTTGNGSLTPVLASVNLPYTPRPPAPDTTPPTISGVSTQMLGASTARITWTTDEQANTRVEYGTSPGPLNRIAEAQTLTTAHSIDLTGLDPATQYSFQVVSTDASGNTARSSTAQFTTPTPDTTAPTISGRNPEPNATGVAVGADISVTFSEPMAAASFTAASYTLRAQGAGSDIPATRTVAGTVATLNPNANLAPGTTYIVTVAGSVTDSAGNALGSAASWSFTTTSAVAIVLEDTTMSQFGAGTPGASTYVANSAGGEVVLAPLVGAEFEGAGVPSGWSTGAWTGGSTTFPGGTASVDGSWLRSTTSGGSGRAIEFSATFTGAPYQNAGFADTLSSANESWALFGTNQTTGVLQARTRSAGGAVVDVPLGAQYVGSEHVFRIEWDASVRFYIDGALVHTATTVAGSMRPLASDYTNGGGGIVLRWARLTPSLPTIAAEFDGSALPSGWASSLWSGGSGGSTVSGGVAAVNGALLRTTQLTGPGSSVEVVATFGAATFQHAGFGVDLAGTSRWAIFSTMGTTDTLYARTNNNGSVTDTSLGTGLVGSAHTYRIDWLADRMVFSVDGTVRHTQMVAITGGMGTVVSDYAAGGASVTVDRVRMAAATRTGVFTSRVLDAGSAADWQALDVAAQGPGGTSVVVEIRRGNTATPDGSWTAFTAVSAGADIPGISRYIQYRATLTGTTTVSPTLERVGVNGLVAP